MALSHLDFGRRAGAPRLIEWTGERCVPWAPDAQVVYEHLHRYLWAAQLVAGRRVLELASGEGFGGAILAGTAASVVGIDLDATTVAHSRLNYESPALTFQVGDASDLSVFADGSFDAVVAFEMIEHVSEQATVLREVRRVLSSGGLLIMSTPDRAAYSEAAGFENPYHVRELDQHEFIALLSSEFEHVAAFGQRAVSGSAIAALADATHAESVAAAFFVSQDGDAWTLAPGLSPRYLIAVASDQELPSIAQTSSLSDGDLIQLRNAERTRDEERQRLVAVYERELAAGRQTLAAEQAEIARLRQHLELIERQRRDAADTLGAARVEVEHLTSLVDEKQHRLDRAQAELLGLGQVAAQRSARIGELEAQLVSTSVRLARVENSVLWNAFVTARVRVYGALGGEHSRAARTIQWSLRTVGRAGAAPSGSAQPAPTAIVSGAAGAEQPGDTVPNVVFPEFDNPTVSLVIPVHRHRDLTRQTLQSISERTTAVSYEVIIVDDDADPATGEFLRTVRGAKLVENDENLGYLRSVNRAAKLARGEWLVLCNNDIEVLRGWLSAMLRRAQSADDIGAVTPKYLYPDRSLNEAGAIIWNDGTGWNYGRDASPTDWHYEYRRDVDYGSAAALMVDTALFRELGGYDERYVPMYYEDADLCMAIRARGKRIVYEPAAEVVHFEGSTAGTDPTSGYKRYQEINRTKFASKWRRQLQNAHLGPGLHNVQRAADRQSDPRVVIFDHMVPLWDQDAGSLRMYGVIEALIDLGCRVTLVPDDFQPRQPYTRNLQEMGVSVVYGSVDLAAELALIASEVALVICSRPQVAARWLDLVRGVNSRLPIAYDTVDLHWVRETRRLAAQARAGLQTDGLRARALRELELAMVRASDMTLVVSEDERATVLREVPEATVHVVPTYHRIALVGNVVAPDRRSGVVYVGSFRHPPNIDAAVALVEDVMPHVWREMPDTAVRIVGPEPPPVVEALAGSQVEVTGWVRDIEPVLDSARVLVAPLMYGAGMKGKVTQALACGLPVVTTAIGAEGLLAGDGEAMLVAETPEELAQLTLAVLRDDDLWRRLSERGVALAETVCSPGVLRDRMAGVLDWATTRRDPSRGDGVTTASLVESGSGEPR